MSAQAHTEDQQAQRTLTRPLPEEEEVEQPAIRLFAEFCRATVSAPTRLNPALPPEAITAASLAGKEQVSLRDENPGFNETPALKSGLGLIEWLTACCCISLIANRFLFEWKTSL